MKTLVMTIAKGVVELSGRPYTAQFRRSINVGGS